ncbi:MAG: VTT domain-containing protein [Negativicutes bacterium]|nr:VTT domain-containing protein [Negativicutes bacterium]
MAVDMSMEGLMGLFLLAFTDSFISPIIPEVILLPLCLANRELAVYYAMVAWIASILGSFIGYSIGYKIGPVCVTKFVPEKHWLRIKALVDQYGAWALLWGAIAPIPYKVISISAGVLNINIKVFALVTMIGRAKRFMIEGILIYYLGETVIEIGQIVLAHKPLLFLVTFIIILGAYHLTKYLFNKPDENLKL